MEHEWNTDQRVPQFSIAWSGDAVSPGPDAGAILISDRMPIVRTTELRLMHFYAVFLYPCFIRVSSVARTISDPAAAVVLHARNLRFVARKELKGPIRDEVQ